tara:strand:+ start:211 stop:462 length:252 start_codon:yes stop_codon:yes gene_type:complete
MDKNQLKHDIILLEQFIRMVFEAMKYKKFKKRKVKYIEKELLKMVRIVIKSVFSSYEDYQQYVVIVNNGLENFYEEKIKEFEA